MQRRAVDFGLELQNFPSLITYSFGLWASDRTLLQGRQGGHGEDVMFTFPGQTWTNMDLPQMGKKWLAKETHLCWLEVSSISLDIGNFVPIVLLFREHYEEGVALLEELWNWGWALKVCCFTPLLVALFVVGCDDISQLHTSATLSLWCIGFLLQWTLNSTELWIARLFGFCQLETNMCMYL